MHRNKGRKGVAIFVKKDREDIQLNSIFKIKK